MIIVTTEQRGLNGKVKNDASINNKGFTTLGLDYI